MSWSLLRYILFCVLCLQSVAEDRCTNVTEGNQTRIAIGFYGISRQLRNVMYTFQNHLFDVLDRANIKYDVFWATMAAPKTTATYSHPESGPLNRYDVMLMEPCQFTIMDQEAVRLREFGLFAKARGIQLSPKGDVMKLHDSALDEFSDNFVSVKNSLCALHTQAVLQGIIHAHEKLGDFKYDAVVALRPDTAMMRDIDIVENIEHIKKSRNSIWIPDFQPWWGYNDRAAYGTGDAMSIYLKRGTAFRDAPGVYPLSERLVKHVLDAHNVTVHPTSVRVLRVRPNREVDEYFAYMNVLRSEWDRCVTGTTQRGGNFTETC